eukprot:430120-Amphidinium_carterae.1
MGNSILFRGFLSPKRSSRSLRSKSADGSRSNPPGFDACTERLRRTFADKVEKTRLLENRFVAIRAGWGRKSRTPHPPKAPETPKCKSRKIPNI